MTPEEFTRLDDVTGFGLALQALWQDAQGNWDRAHDLAQAANSADGNWVHAYLHRKEGDQGNADYWYRRAGRPPSGESLAQEWSQMVATLLAADAGSDRHER